MYPKWTSPRYNNILDLANGARKIMDHTLFNLKVFFSFQSFQTLGFFLIIGPKEASKSDLELSLWVTNGFIWLLLFESIVMKKLIHKSEYCNSNPTI